MDELNQRLEDSQAQISLLVLNNEHLKGVNEQLQRQLSNYRADSERMTTDCHKLRENCNQLEIAVKSLIEENHIKDQQRQHDYVPILEHRKEVAALTVRLSTAQAQLKETQAKYIDAAVRFEDIKYKLVSKNSSGLCSKEKY